MKMTKTESFEDVGESAQQSARVWSISYTSYRSKMNTYFQLLLAFCLCTKVAEGFQSSVVPPALLPRGAASTTSAHLFNLRNKQDTDVTATVSKDVLDTKKDTSIFGGFFPSPAANSMKELEVEPEDESWTDFGKDPITYAYAATWAGLVTFALFLAPGELSSPSDAAMINSIIANPAAPDMNLFYYAVFNLFALIPVVLGCTIAPRAISDKGIPAGPPLFLSTFIAYFVMGPYLALRKTPKEVIVDPSTEFGWVTRNVWENKLVNYGTVAFGFLCLASGLPAFEDPAANFQGMLDLITSSRFASVSFADLTMITLILTKEVADDYKIRCDPEDINKAPLIGASTALLPILGTAIYCAVRPSFPEDTEA